MDDALDWDEDPPWDAEVAWPCAWVEGLRASLAEEL